MQLRVENRPVPYYQVVNEFFNKKLANFVEPDHTCTCNICCFDMESIKRQAVDEVRAQMIEAG